MRFLSTLAASALGTLIALGIVFFFGMLILFAFVAAADQTPSVSGESVLVLDLEGPIPETVSGDPLMQAFADEPPFGLADVVSSIDKAAADDRIEAIWIKIRDVGGPWARLEEIRGALLRFKESGKPLYASSNDYMMAEHEYFLASAADSVFASEQAMFEFNGFYSTAVFFQNTLEMLEVEPQIVRAGRFKSAVEPFLREDLSPENRMQLTALLESQNDVFMNAVAESRGTTVDELNAIVEQRAVIATTEGYELGLIDGLLYEDQVVDVIKGRLGVDQDDDLETISMASYNRVPASDAGLEVNRDGEIAVVYAEGSIVSGESERASPLGDVTLGAETIKDALEEARENDSIDAVVVRIDSPGGSASASDAIWRAIRLTADEKPVVVSMGGLAASGGYWIATAAETIVADPLTLTGSIGVFAMMFDVSGFFESKLGVTFDDIQTAPYADLFSGIRPLEDRERAMLEGWVDDTYQDFLTRVAQSRGLEVAEVDSIGEGRIWSGTQALEVGLVDTLGTLRDAIQIAARQAGLDEGPYRVRILPRPKTFIEQLQASMNARAMKAWMKLSRTPAERAILEQARTLKAAVGSYGEVQARLPVEITIQ